MDVVLVIGRVLFALLWVGAGFASACAALSSEDMVRVLNPVTHERVSTLADARLYLSQHSLVLGACC
jgi:hypothetical protein